MSCILGVEQSCSECRMCQDKKEEEKTSTETVKERKDDLISRSTLKEHIERYADIPYYAKQEVYDRIDDCNTAYDVDEVIDKLSKQAEQYHARADEFILKGMNRQHEYMAGKAYSYEHAIEIVKAGRVNG